MGEAWWKSYYSSLSPENQAKVTIEDPGKVQFRFGGDEILYARYKAGFSALATECLCRDCRENFICASSPLEPPETCTRV